MLRQPAASTRGEDGAVRFDRALVGRTSRAPKRSQRPTRLSRGCRGLIGCVLVVCLSVGEADGPGGVGASEVPAGDGG